MVTGQCIVPNNYPCRHTIRGEGCGGNYGWQQRVVGGVLNMHGSIAWARVHATIRNNVGEFSDQESGFPIEPHDRHTYYRMS